MFASSPLGDIFWERGVKAPVMKQTKGKYPAPLKIIEVISLVAYFIHFCPNLHHEIKKKVTLLF